MRSFLAALRHVLWATLSATLWAALLAGAAQAQVVELREARFTRDDDAGAQRVVLPDTWRQRGLGTTGAGRYRLSLRMEALPSVPYGVSFTRVSSTRLAAAA